MSLTIKKLEKNDEELLREWAELIAMEPFFHDYGITLERSLENIKRRFAQVERHFYVAIDEERVVCGVLEVVEKAVFAVAPYIQVLAVRAQRQGRGVGSHLLGVVEREWRGKFGLFLLVNEKNERAVRFYKKSGFQELGLLPGFIQSEKNELIMWKKGL